MYNKLNLDVAKFASKSTLKPELASVAFYGNKTVASDSFRLVEVGASGEASDAVLINAKDLSKTVKISSKEKIDIEKILSRSDVPPVNGKFPDYESILKPASVREDDVKVTINGKLLGEILVFMAQANKFGQVELSIPLKSGLPVLLTGGNNNQPIKALCMPIIR
jgi:DNA polymerase III sliding clamp (beta) subunit (PCNA family)